MKKPLLIACILVLGASAGALNLAQFGAEVVSTVAEGERTAAVLRDSAGRTFTVSLMEDPSPAVAAQLVKLKDRFCAWRSVKVGSLRFTVTGSLIEAVLFPESLIAGGADLRQYVPAGLFFSWSSILDLQYDFRVTKDHLFLRVSGIFTSEEEMVNKVADALANPNAYLQRGDTEYLLARLDASQKEIASLREAQAAMEKDLSAQVERLRYAAMALENKDWFSAKPITREGIARILALKKESPTLTWKEAAATLKAEKVKITDKEIQIVFKYYFGE